MKTRLALWKCEKCGRVWKQHSSMKRINSGMTFCIATLDTDEESDGMPCGSLALLVKEGCWKKVFKREVMPK